jgi:hypothetical protein
VTPDERRECVVKMVCWFLGGAAMSAPGLIAALILFRC